MLKVEGRRSKVKGRRSKGKNEHLNIGVLDMTEDKMIVVVLVAGLILLGLAGFLFYLEYRLRKSEKQIRELQKRQMQ